MKKVLITSGKGGTGKSTVAAGCALALGRLKKRVLLVDADAGLRGVDLLLGMECAVAFDVGDVLAGRCEASAALLKVPGAAGVHLLAGPSRQEDFCDATTFRNMVTRLSSEYDFILIDSPSGFGSGFAVAAAGADLALVVTQPDALSLRGAAKTVAPLADAGIKEAYLLINRFDRKRKSMPGIDPMIDTTRLQLFGIVPEDSGFSPGFTQDFTAQKHPMAEAFLRLGRRLCGENVPLSLGK